MRPSKFNFIPIDQIEVSTRSGEYATVAPKYKKITFSKDYVNNKQLEGKLIKFYWDYEKKLLGWRFVNKSSEGFSDLAGSMVIRGTPIMKGGTEIARVYGFSLTKLMKNVKLDKDNYKKLPIEVAKKAIFGEDISYVKL